MGRKVWLDQAEEAGLGAAHAQVAGLGGVLLTAKVEESVEDVGEDFFFQAEALGVALTLSHGRAEEDFPVLEGDHIGGGGIAEKILVDAGTGGGGKEGDLDGMEVGGEPVVEAGDGRLGLAAEAVEGQGKFTLTVVQADRREVLWGGVRISRLCPFPGGLWGIRCGHGACF